MTSADGLSVNDLVTELISRITVSVLSHDIWYGILFHQNARRLLSKPCFNYEHMINRVLCHSSASPKTCRIMSQFVRNCSYCGQHCVMCNSLDGLFLNYKRDLNCVLFVKDFQVFSPKCACSSQKTSLSLLLRALLPLQIGILFH